MEFSRRQFLATAAPVAPAQIWATKKRPSILFVMSDSNRFDAMSCAGAKGNRLIQPIN
jgi:hypothetical protein